MPTLNESKQMTISGNLVTVQTLQKTWSHSPRVNGVLRLQVNAYQLRKALFEAWFQDAQMPRPPLVPPTAPSGSEYIRARDGAYASAYAKFRGRLYGGSASLGVTLGSLGQTRSMITSRVSTLRSDSASLLADAFLSRRKGKDASGLILETMFGWVPLFSDIHALTTSVIQRADALAYVRGSGKSPWRKESFTNSGSYTILSVEEGVAISTYASAVTISNPNLWLAERAGLVNYAAVAWDLVPWSFLVNAFSNTGSLVNSLTDFSGLTFSNASTTTKWDFKTTKTNIGVSAALKGKVSHSVSRSLGQSRLLSSSPPSPPLVFKVPNLDYSTAAIGLSLVIQNMGKLKPLYTLGNIALRSLRRKS